MTADRNNPSPEEIAACRAAVEKRVQAEAALEETPDDPAPNPISDALLVRALDENERGDAMIYALKNRGKICRVASQDKIYVYNPDTGHWSFDYAGAALTAVEAVALEYEKFAWRLRRDGKESQA